LNKILLSFLFALLCSYYSTAISDPYFYINHQQGDGGISVFNRNTLTLKRKIPSFLGPAGIAISAHKPWFATAHPDEGIISFFDNTQLIPLELVSVSGSPFGAIFANELLFYSDWSNNSVGVINPDTGRVIKKIAVGKSPAGLATNSCETQVWVTNREGNSVSVIDSHTFKLLKTIPVGRAPFALDMDNHFAYVANSQSNTLSIIDLITLTQTKQVKIGRMPYGVAISQKHHKVYVSNQSENTVSVLDSRTHKVIKTLKTGEYPENIAVDEENNHLFVLNWFDGTLSVFDSKTDKEIKRIKVEDGSRAFGQFVSNPAKCQ
jgi:YVTN family beta-propeller protein